MDLQSFNPTESQIEQARDLVVHGLMGYQPWKFSEDFECGVGLEFERDEYCGYVYLPNVEHDPALRFIEPELLPSFRKANQKLAELYEGIADKLTSVLKDIGGESTLDVGCNSGYFPVAFSRRGVPLAMGCDRERGFARSLALLNEIVGANATFLPTSYIPQSATIPNAEQADLVTSLAVLCHVSDPLSKLAALSKQARKALFAWTIVNEDRDLTMHYGDPRGDYAQDVFPFCFDNRVCPSRSLMHRSFELLGFKTIIEFPGPSDGLPLMSVRGLPFYGLLGLR